MVLTAARAIKLHANLLAQFHGQSALSDPIRHRLDRADTPLSRAREAGIAVLCLKDEAERFGLGSFKALGGAYAVAGILADEVPRRGVAQAASSVELASGHYREATEAITVTCATDGNHGRSVAGSGSV